MTRPKIGLCEYCGDFESAVHWQDKLYVDTCSLCNLMIYSGDTVPRKFWTTMDGRQIAMSDMDLGHLANTIRMLGPKLAEARESGNKRYADQIERDLLDLQAEHDSRDKEIEQAQGIAAAIFRSINRK